MRAIHCPANVLLQCYDLESDIQSDSVEITAFVREGTISLIMYYFDSVALILMYMKFRILKSQVRQRNN
jgi:hypothetical protein